MTPGLTVQIMVRNEKWTIWESIMSTVPFAKAAVIIDTGSTDGTQELIKDAIKRLKVPVIYKEITLPEQSSWSCVMNEEGRDVSPHPSRDLGDVRNVMRDYSDTEWLWTVDADEVYLPESAQAVVDVIHQGVRPQIECMYVPILWTGHDPAKESVHSDPGTYGLTGRLFSNNLSYVHANLDLAIKWDVRFPGEAAHYFNPATGRWKIPAPNDKNCCVVSFGKAPPVMHYEMASKPWRRRCLEDKPIEWPIPPVFAERKAIFGNNLFSAFAEKVISQTA